MKKLFRRIAVFMALIIGVCSMASCGSSEDFYDEWEKAGVTSFDDDYKVFKEISLDKAVEKKEANVTFTLILATSDDTNAVSTMDLFADYAKDLDYKGTIFVVDTTDIIKEASKRKDVSTRLGITFDGGVDLNGYNFVVVYYYEGTLKVDTSSKKGAYQNEEFQNNNSVDYDALIYYIYSGDIDLI